MRCKFENNIKNVEQSQNANHFWVLITDMRKIVSHRTKVRQTGQV
jgi:hypothetical protein